MKLTKKYRLFKSDWRGENFEKVKDFDYEGKAMSIMCDMAVNSPSSDWKVEEIYVGNRPADML